MSKYKNATQRIDGYSYMHNQGMMTWMKHFSVLMSDECDDTCLMPS
jgi:hypothetical protein